MYMGYQPGVTPDDVLVVKPPASFTPKPGQYPNALQSIAEALRLYQLQRLQNENTERQARGVQPLNYSDVPGLQPVNDFSQSVDNRVWIIAALGAGALFLFMSNRGPRRVETELDMED